MWDDSDAGYCIPGFLTSDGKKDTALAVIADTTVDEIKENALDNIPVVSLDENDNQDGSAQNISSQMNAGRNPFVNAATFNFSAVRFRIRGYDADLFTTYMNGAPMENLDNGFTPYGLWGGLNDVLRNRQSTNGLQAAKYGAGDIGGTSYIDSRAFRQRRQTTINYAVANRNYTNRVYITHSTGMSKKAGPSVSPDPAVGQRKDLPMVLTTMAGLYIPVSTVSSTSAICFRWWCLPRLPKMAARALPCRRCSTSPERISIILTGATRMVKKEIQA